MRYFQRMISFFLLAATFVSPYTCTNDVLRENYHNQNMCQLLSEIPPELKDLPYAIYPNHPSYDTARFIYNKCFNLFSCPCACPCPCPYALS